jgi:hypothetical protein
MATQPSYYLLVAYGVASPQPSLAVAEASAAALVPPTANYGIIAVYGTQPPPFAAGAGAPGEP